MATYRVSNLFSFERRCTGARISSDSETVEVEGLQRHRNKLPPYLKNPMDFKFFDQVVRSDDEASSLAQWQKLKNKLISAPVTPALNWEDFQEQNQHEVDLQVYLGTVFKVLFDRKARGRWPKSHTYLSGLNFHGFFNYGVRLFPPR